MDSNLLKTDKCSPLVVYLFSVVLFSIMIYLNHNNFKKFKNTKLANFSNNVFTMYTWNEISLLLIVGITMFGMCQYNQETLAWIILFIPIIVLIVKIYIVYNNINLFNKYLPSDEEIDHHKKISNLQPNQPNKPNEGGSMFNPLNENVKVENKTNMITNLNKPSNLDNRELYNPPLMAKKSTDSPSAIGTVMSHEFSSF